MSDRSAFVKLLAASLAALTLASAAGCGSASEAVSTSAASDTVTETEAETAAPDSLAARALVSDGLPDYDAQGYAFTFLICQNETDYIVAEESGDVVEDAVYARNSKISDRFNVTFADNLQTDYGKVSDYIRKSLNAGEDSYDLISSHVVGLGSNVLEGSFLNWYDVKYIDFSKPWWAPSTSTDLTYNKRAYIAVGDLAISSIADTYCVYYNKKLGGNYNIPDMYALVDDGGWTIDKQIELTSNIYEDLNGNGAKDGSDFFGFISDASSNINTYLWAFENPIITKNSAGELEFVIKTERMDDIVTKLVTMFDSDQGCFTEKDNNHMNIGDDDFRLGQCVFANGKLKSAVVKFRDMEDDYAILPYPKWDEAQTAYHTMSDGEHDAMAISSLESDPDRVGIITEALNAESYKSVAPAYYDVALKVKGARDEQSVAMMDLLVNSRVFDMGYVYDGWSGASFWLQTLVQKRSTDFESFYAKNSAKVIKHYDELIAYFNT
jgi:hypothetical protein